MLSIVCEEPGRLTLKDAVLPSLRTSNEAMVKVLSVGICGTDLHAYAGNQAYFTYPRILGHELAVEVVEVDTHPRGIQKGDRAIVMPYMSCGHCVACRNGKTNCCIDMQVMGVHVDGGMQEYLVIPNELLIPAVGLSGKEIALVEPLAIGAHALRRAQIRLNDTILVIGCGPIGLGIIGQANIQGCQVLAMDVQEHRINFVKENFSGVQTLIANSNSGELLAELTQGDLASVVIDATGNRKALESGIQFMAHGGRYILVGLSNGSLTFHHPAIHAKESSILCSRNATMEDFIFVRATLEKGAFPVDHYITHEVSNNQLIENIHQWMNPALGVIKAMMNF